MIIFEMLKAVFYGMLEGVTEWLPISSTGHIILCSEFLPLDFSRLYGESFGAEFFEMFEVVIQLGAVAAVAVIYFKRLNPIELCGSLRLKKDVMRLWGKVIVACLPSAVVGIILELFFSDFLERIYTPLTVAAMLIIYGILFVAVERGMRQGEHGKLCGVEDIGLGRALAVGAFQALAVIPGTSRSGSTVLGARLMGISRAASAEFSFFMAFPTMLGASAVKTLGFISFVSEGSVKIPAESMIILAVSMLCAFLVSLAVIRFLVSFVSRRGFAPFGVYRIVLGIAVIAYFVFLKK